MKIVCDSCSAKYSIADEKVAGKSFKIRCKKCGAAIVVRGDQQGAADAGAGGYDYGGEAVWHAVVEGDQQGPFTPAQLGQMISEEKIGWDAYVWREGFDDWKPAQDIEELVQAIMNPGGAPAAEADPFSEAAPVESAPVAAAAPFAAAKSSSIAPKRDAGADLFAASSASPFGGGDDDVVASPSGPRVSAQQAMTGQRNENSVLFSLSNLQALATGGAASAGPAKAAPKAGMAAGEGSGLIDIRALASATGMGMGGAPAPQPMAPRVDDLLSIGAPAVGLGSALAAPVIIAERKPEKSNTPLLVGAGLAAVVVLAITAVVVASMLGGGTDPAVAAAAPTAIAPGQTPPATPTAAVGAVAAPGAPVAPGAPAAPVAAADPAAAAAAAGTPAPAAPAVPAAEPAGGGGGGGRRPRGGGGGGGTTAAAEPAPAAEPAAAPARPARGGGGGGSDQSIDDLLSNALSGSPSRPARGGAAAPAAAPAGGGGPETPGRADVVSAMQGVTPAVQACGNGEHGTATVALTVTGSTGRVTGANVTGQFAGTPIGSCIARAVRGATFPHFSRPTFTVNYPFRL
jgi:predicted Zn finger-like uncharacterized protein